jgi:hypothetical protein
MEGTMFAGDLQISENQALRIVDGLSVRQPSLEAYKADPCIAWKMQDGVLQG